MLYRPPSTIRSNADYFRKQVSGQMKTLEGIAAERQTAALDAADYEVMLYSKLTQGRRCLCVQNRTDPLDEHGNLLPTSMDALLGVIDNAPGFTDVPNLSDFAIGDYGEGEYGYTVPTEESHTLPPQPGDPDPEGSGTEGEDLDGLDDDIDSLDKFDIDNSIAGAPSLASLNCPLCMRTGWIGGFRLWNGTRFVLTGEDFELTGTGLGEPLDNLPTWTSISEDTRGSAEITLALPKSVVAPKSIRLMHGKRPVPTREWSLVVDGMRLSSPSKLFDYFDGEEHLIELQFGMRPWTHLDIEVVTHRRPLLIDRSLLTFESGVSDGNQLGSVTGTFPARIKRLRRGDVFFDANSSAMWVLTAVELLQTSHTRWAWTISADVVRSDYEPYSLHNPYVGKER